MRWTPNTLFGVKLIFYFLKFSGFIRFLTCQTDFFIFLLSSSVWLLCLVKTEVRQDMLPRISAENKVRGNE